MSYAPQPYPPQYGYPPGYPRPSAAGPSARWAGIIAAILAVLALLIGGLVIGYAPRLIEIAQEQNDPSVNRAIEQLSEMGSKPEVLFYIFGGMFIGYGVVVAAVAAILLSTRSKVGPIIGLVAFVPITLFLLINLLPAVLQANPQAVIMGLLMLAPHGLILYWLAKSLRAGAPTPMMYPGYPGYPTMQVPPPPQPMQGYYQPPRE